MARRSALALPLALLVTLEENMGKKNFFSLKFFFLGLRGKGKGKYPSVGIPPAKSKGSYKFLLQLGVGREFCSTARLSKLGFFVWLEGMIWCCFYCSSLPGC